MSKTRVPTALRRLVVGDSHNLCAYCHSWLTITGARPVIDHIISEAAGGATVRDNLCLICHACNEFKGPSISAYDSLTREVVALFHPRRQVWREHFAWTDKGSIIIGITSTGRATVIALKMNHLEIVEARRRWISVGWHPPQEDL